MHLKHLAICVFCCQMGDNFAPQLLAVCFVAVWRQVCALLALRPMEHSSGKGGGGGATRTRWRLATVLVRQEEEKSCMFSWKLVGCLFNWIGASRSLGERERDRDRKVATFDFICAHSQIHSAAHLVGLHLRLTLLTLLTLHCCLSHSSKRLPLIKWKISLNLPTNQTDGQPNGLPQTAGQPNGAPPQ